MSARRISLTGIDGSGKTTIVREIARRYASDPSYIQTFRAPQFHESVEVPHAELSADIDALSVLADRRQDPVLKATCLFLSMTLYGDVERHFLARFHPVLLIGERQPLLDSLVYATFYSRLVTGPLNREALEAEVEKAIGEEGLERLDMWMSHLGNRDLEVGSGLKAFWSLPLFAKELFELPVGMLLKRLKTLYAVGEPEEVMVLMVSGEELQSRLRQKRGSGTERELHERRAALDMLQNGMKGALASLRSAYPKVLIQEIPTGSLGVAETCDRVLSLLSGESFTAQVVDHPVKGTPDLSQ